MALERTRRGGGDARRGGAAFGHRDDPRGKRSGCREEPAEAGPSLARRELERGGERPLDAAAIAALALRRRALGGEALGRGRGAIAPEPKRRGFFAEFDFGEGLAPDELQKRLALRERHAVRHQHHDAGVGGGRGRGGHAAGLETGLHGKRAAASERDFRGAHPERRVATATVHGALTREHPQNRPQRRLPSGVGGCVGGAGTGCALP